MNEWPITGSCQIGVIVRYVEQFRARVPPTKSAVKEGDHCMKNSTGTTISIVVP